MVFQVLTHAVVYFVLDLADELGIPPEKAFLEFSGFKELLPALENFLI